MIILNSRAYEPKRGALELLQGFGFLYVEKKGLNQNHVYHPVATYDEQAGLK